MPTIWTCPKCKRNYNIAWGRCIDCGTCDPQTSEHGAPRISETFDPLLEAMKRETRPVLLGAEKPDSYHFWSLLNRRLPTVTLQDFIEAFDHRKINGTDCYAYPGRSVVVLGNAARVALQLPPLLLHPMTAYGTTWRQIPSQQEWYEEPTHRDLVAMLLESLYLTWRKRCT